MHEGIAAAAVTRKSKAAKTCQKTSWCTSHCRILARSTSFPTVLFSAFSRYARFFRFSSASWSTKIPATLQCCSVLSNVS